MAYAHRRLIAIAIAFSPLTTRKWDKIYIFLNAFQTVILEKGNKVNL